MQPLKFTLKFQGPKFQGMTLFNKRSYDEKASLATQQFLKQYVVQDPKSSLGITYDIAFKRDITDPTCFGIAATPDDAIGEALDRKLAEHLRRDDVPFRQFNRFIPVHLARDLIEWVNGQTKNTQLVTDFMTAALALDKNRDIPFKPSP